MSVEMVTLTYYWNKIFDDRKCVSYKDPLLVTTVIRSQAPFHEFMDKLYQVTTYEKQCTLLTVIPDSEGVHSVAHN